MSTTIQRIFRSYCEHPGTANVLSEWISVTAANYLNKMAYNIGAAQAFRQHGPDFIWALHRLPE